MKEPIISFIIGSFTLDRLNDIEDLFVSIKNQTYSNYEVIFVSDNNEELQKAVDKLNKKIKFKNYYSFLNFEKGLSHVRNLGVSKAKGEYIAFIDDDAILSKDWTKILVETYEKYPNSGGLTGTIKPYWIEKKPLWYPKELYWIFSCSYQEINTIQNVRNGFGANLSFRKRIMDLVGTFNSELGYNLSDKKSKFLDGEEVDYCIKVKEKTGMDIIFNPKLEIQHKVYPFRYTLKFLIKKCYGDGYAKGLIKSLHKSETISTENDYLKLILFKTIPENILSLLKGDLKKIKSISFIFLAVIFVGLGYLKFQISN